MTAPPATKPVLCVLTDEQQRHYADGLGVLRARGARIIVHTDPTKAFTSLETDKPLLVLVGNWVEDMEGLEFLARMLRRFPDFDGRIVVLPEEGDPFPPMVHHRPRPGARSEAVSTNFGEMAGWLDEPTGRAAPVAAAGAAAGATPPPSRPKTPALHHTGSGTPVRNARMRGGSRDLPLAWKIALPTAVAVFVFIVVFLLYGRGAEKTAPVPDPETDEPPAPAAVTEEPPPAAPPAAPSPAGEKPPEPAGDSARPAKPAGFPRGEYVTLPLSFPADAAPFSVKDPDKLKEILAALDEALRQDRRLKAELGGHTSPGTTPLGRARAESIKPLLVRAGIDPKRIVVRNYGSRLLVVRTRSDDERNRRVTIRIISGRR